MEQVTIPKFANEEEEATWWFKHQDVMLDEFELAAKEGRVGRGSAMKRALAADAGIALDPEDARKALKLAAKHGMSYEEYVKKLFHEAVERDIAAEAA